MEELPPIVQSNVVDPSKKTMSPETGKKHLLIVSIVFGAIYILALAVIIAGAVLESQRVDPEPTVLLDARAGYYDAEHRPVEGAVFSYERSGESSGSTLSLVSAPSEDAYALVLPRYEQPNLNSVPQYVTSTKDFDSSSNIFANTALNVTISDLYFSSYISRIGSYSFSGSTGIKHVYGSFHPSSLIIGDGAFYHSASLLSFEFPKSLSRIGNEAFAGTALAEVDLKDTSLSRVGDRAFADCESLVSFSLPATVSDWGEAILSGTSVETVTFGGTKDNLPDEATIQKAFEGSKVSQIVFSDGSSLAI